MSFRMKDLFYKQQKERVDISFLYEYIKPLYVNSTKAVLFKLHLFFFSIECSNINTTLGTLLKPLFTLRLLKLQRSRKFLTYFGLRPNGSRLYLFQTHCK